MRCARRTQYSLALLLLLLLSAQLLLIGEIKDERQRLQSELESGGTLRKELLQSGLWLEQCAAERREIEAMIPQKMADGAVAAAFIRERLKAAGIETSAEKAVNGGGGFFLAEGECLFSELVGFMMIIKDFPLAVRINRLSVVGRPGGLVGITAEVEYFKEDTPLAEPS